MFGVTCPAPYVQIISAVFAIAAGCLWLRASLIPVPKEITTIIGYDRGGIGGELADLTHAVWRQGRWNAWAAFSASIAALTQGVGAFLPACADYIQLGN